MATSAGAQVLKHLLSPSCRSKWQYRRRCITAMASLSHRWAGPFMKAFFRQQAPLSIGLVPVVHLISHGQTDDVTQWRHAWLFFIKIFTRHSPPVAGLQNASMSSNGSSACFAGYAPIIKACKVTHSTSACPRFVSAS